MLAPLHLDGPILRRLGRSDGSGFVTHLQGIPDRGLRREKVAALLGFILLAIAGVGTILVGSFPENTNGNLHITGAVMAIGVGNVGILLLGFALVSIPEGLRHFILASASVSLVAAISFGMKHHFGLGAGGMRMNPSLSGDCVVNHVRDLHNQGPLLERLYATS